MVRFTVLTIAFLIALMVWFATWLQSHAHAETLHRGKVYKTTADRIIADRQLVCSYAKPRFEALPDGRMVIINGKTCIEVSGKR